MGPVTLKVGTLDDMTAYYRDAVALQVLSQTGDAVTLGRGTTPVMILEGAPELRHASPRDAGLYYPAILFDTEEALAASVYGVASRLPGSGHHTLKHHTRWKVKHEPGGDGILTWTPPGGHDYSSVPEGARRFPKSRCSRRSQQRRTD